MSEIALIDFESRSACNLKLSGSWRYSLDPTTQVLCLAFRLPHWVPGRVELWHPAIAGLPESGLDDSLSELLDWIQDGGLIEAHNASFERGIWTNIMVARYGWPAVNIEQWRCSAAKAASHALPRNLADCAKALKLDIAKDTSALQLFADAIKGPGKRAMTKLSKPRKPRKAERAAGVTGLLWWESEELLAAMWDYCKQDVLAEEAVSAAIPDLNPAEQAMYTLDQIINERGFQLDTEAVETALSLIATETAVLNSELAVLTGGQVKKATQRAQMINWLSEEGLQISDTQKETIDDTLKTDDLSVPVRRGLELMRALGRSSTAKYGAMAAHMDSDGRVMGGLLYHGASTGRWSGSGVQPHNFPKGTVKDQDGLWEVLKTRDREFIAAQYKGVMEALSNGLRGAIVAKAGHRLYVADYAGIEARVVQWLADDQDALDFFRTGGDPYKDMASSIYKVPIPEVSKDQRQLGKAAILGAGFGMGWAKFVSNCADVWGLVIEDELAQTTIAAYREKFWLLVDMWRDQENAALRAVSSRQPVDCGYVTWHRTKEFLYCQLPSGRNLAYPFPQIRMRMTPWGEEKPALTFMGINTYTKKWERQGTYGGSLVENITQAVARDIMADAMMRCGGRGYPVVLTVHDEIIAEVPLLAGSVQEFEQILTTVPDWAEGCPIGAEGWVGTRYRK